VLANEALAAFHGTTVGELLGRVAPEPARLVPGTIEESVTDPRTGAQRWFHTVRVPIRVGTDPLLLSVATDVTERRTLEEQVRAVQKLEAVGTLAGGIAHDFNNLLATVRATADLILLDCPEGQMRADVQQIAGLAERATALTGQLLAFSRRQVLDTRIVDANVLVADLVRMIRPMIGEDIRLAVMPAAHPARIAADPGQIEQVLMNLCVNARDAMPAGGELAIRLDRAQVDEGFCAAHRWARPGDYVRVTVSDTGLGMDQATLARIFEPFFTTKALGRGTGLGLAVVYGIVKQHEGMIHAYSEPGHGTTFRLYFPFQADALSAPAPRPAVEPLPRGTGRILLAEDDAMLRATARRMLTGLGYEVLLAADGPEALALLNEHGADLALAIVDLVMPGMPGLAVFEAARRRHPALRVLFATGYSPGSSQFPGLERLPAPVLAKPYGLTELATAVRRAIDAEPDAAS
jgi:signal transduction histidine kinase/ActR/RegA family two-component response regulator